MSGNGNGAGQEWPDLGGDIQAQLASFNDAVLKAGQVAIDSDVPPLVVLTATIIDMAILLEYDREWLEGFLAEKIAGIWDERAAAMEAFAAANSEPT